MFKTIRPYIASAIFSLFAVSAMASDEVIVRHSTTSVTPITYFGDSITAGTVVSTSPAVVASAILSARLGSTISANNRGLSGSTSEDWTPGAGPYDAGKASAIAAGGHNVMIMVGTNDAKTAVATSPQVYRQRLEAAAYDLAQSGLLLQVSYPPLLASTSNPFDASSPSMIIAYRAAIDAAVSDGTLIAGDRSATGIPLQPDGVHPTQDGSDLLAALWAASVSLPEFVTYQKAVIGQGITITGNPPTIQSNGSGPPPPNSHLYWRVLITAVGPSNDGYSSFEEVQFMAGGVALPVAATLASTDYYGLAGAYAFDGDTTTTAWATTAGHAIGYVGARLQFAATVDSVSLLALNAGEPYRNGRAPSALSIDYSDDGLSWHSAASYAGLTGWTSSPRVLSVP